MKQNGLIEPNDFVMLSMTPSDWYILRVTDAVPIDITYFPENEIVGFQALAPFGSPAQTPYQSFFSDNIQFSMQEFTNITNIFEPNVVGMSGKDWLLQIQVGIAPSYVKLYKYYPSTTPLGNFLSNGKIHWGGREQNFQIDGISGFDSPVSDISKDSEFYLPPQLAYTFALVNMASVPASPQLKFRINQMVVEPVSSVSLASKILDRVVPSKIASIGAFNRGVKPDIKLYGVEPVTLDATTTDLQNAGYGGA